MFASKKEILNQVLTSNSFTQYKTVNQEPKSYSPIQIQAFPPTSKSKSLLHQSHSTFKSRKSSINPLRISKTMIQGYRTSISLSQTMKKPSIIQTILDFKSKVSNKYTKYYLLLSHSETRPIEYEDILNHLKIKQFSKEFKTLIGHSKVNPMHLVSQLSKAFMRAFDINNKFSVSLEDFLGVCSVHEVFFPNINFNFLNSAWLGKLKVKIDELKKTFGTYAGDNNNKAECLLSMVNDFVGVKDRMSFVGFIKSSNINFAFYLQILPVFMNLENSYF